MASYGAQHLIELRFEGVTVSKTIRIEPDFCLTSFPNVIEYSEGYCMYESGDIRFGSNQATATGGLCVGDGFCRPDCPCTTQERCTSRVVSTAPFVSHLGCAPVGPRAVGESCALIADPEGAYDDCGADLLCVSGTCRQRCIADGSSCAACEYVEGHAPELRICVP